MARKLRLTPLRGESKLSWMLQLGVTRSAMNQRRLLMIGALASGLGSVVSLVVYKSEFILPSNLVAENAGSGSPSLIPPGMRAVSLGVNEVVSVAGFVGAGTRVDILLIGRPDGSSENQTTTLLRNVSVIAAGQRLERNAAGDAQNTPVITVLVSPDDAEKLALATQEGHIRLILRNPDTKQETPPPAAGPALS